MANEDALEPELAELIRYIQDSRGVDFRGYKKTSLRRRLRHRMETVGVEGFAAYHAFLEAHPQEFSALLDTVLINVTSFFRDPDAWDVLRTSVVPRILDLRPSEDPIRIWSAGCATGQEPYSLAMLFADALGVDAFARRVKVYATDLDEAALQVARQATYGPRDVEGVPPELLGRYFERANNHYVFSRELRRCVIFGRHNLATDAPIGRVDLLACRNLLIYLESETQDSVLPRLHYALRDDGHLFLGKTETQLARSRLFEPVDVRNRIFRKAQQPWRRDLAASVTVAAFDGGRDGRGPASLHAQLLQGIAETSGTAHLAVEPENGLLVYANPAARRLLDVSEADVGRPFRDLAAYYRPVELRDMIDEAQRLRRPLRLENQEHPRPASDPVRLSIAVAPLLGSDGRVVAVLLSFTDTTHAFQLQRELQATQENLKTYVEELQSANEELETTNEELQSTNEELETINEELRSANEELESTNDQLRFQTRAASEYRIYAESILRSFTFGVVVVDADLNVRSWSRWNEDVWGLRADEVTGRPFLDLDIGLPVQRLRPELLRALAGEVQDTVVRAVNRRGRVLRCRVRASPLLLDGPMPHGAVLALEDATGAEMEAERAEYLGRVVGRSANEVYFLDPATLRFLMVNEGAERKLGHPLARLRKMSLPDVLPHLRPGELDSLVEPLIKGAREEAVFETAIRSADGGTYPAEVCMQHFPDEEPPVLLAIVHDTTERQTLRAAG